MHDRRLAIIENSLNSKDQRLLKIDTVFDAKSNKLDTTRISTTSALVDQERCFGTCKGHIYPVHANKPSLASFALLPPYKHIRCLAIIRRMTESMVSRNRSAESTMPNRSNEAHGSDSCSSRVFCPASSARQDGKPTQGKAAALLYARVDKCDFIIKFRVHAVCADLNRKTEMNLQQIARRITDCQIVCQ